MGTKVRVRVQKRMGLRRKMVAAYTEFEINLPMHHRKFGTAVIKAVSKSHSGWVVTGWAYITESNTLKEDNTEQPESHQDTLGEVVTQSVEG